MLNYKIRKQNKRKNKDEVFPLFVLLSNTIPLSNALAVAQLVTAFASHADGWVFESPPRLT